MSYNPKIENIKIENTSVFKSVAGCVVLPCQLFTHKSTNLFESSVVTTIM
jgi:hypothetical protein